MGSGKRRSPLTTGAISIHCLLRHRQVARRVAAKRLQSCALSATSAVGIREAIAAFEKAMAIDPNLASAQWNLSDLLFDRHEQLDHADELLARALANGLPDASKYVIERAIKYQRGGDPQRSLRLLESAVAAQPQDAMLHIFRGRYRVESKNCAGALEDFRAAQEIKPDDPVAFASAGLASLCLGNPADARMYFRKSLALDPNQPMLRKYLGP